MADVPLSDEERWALRMARFLRHARGGRMKGRRVTLTWEEAELALFEHARTVRQLRLKVAAKQGAAA